jgi:hypothetical protein
MLGAFSARQHVQILRRASFGIWFLLPTHDEIATALRPAQQVPAEPVSRKISHEPLGKHKINIITRIIIKHAYAGHLNSSTHYFIL